VQQYLRTSILTTQKNAGEPAQLPSPSSPSRFRNRIYEFTFAGESIGVLPRYAYGIPHPRKAPYSRTDLGVIALLFTSRQIRHEVSALFYSLTTFDLSFFNKFYMSGQHDKPSKSLTTLGLQNFGLIQSIKIHRYISKYAYKLGTTSDRGLASAFAGDTAGLSCMRRVEIALVKGYWAAVQKEAVVNGMRIWFARPDLEVVFGYDTT
jgi:hypothetical protein